MLLRFANFLGANKALHPLRLPEGVGIDSLNQRPGRGDLRPWHETLQVASVPAGQQTIYRMGRDVPSDATYWLSWPSDVDVVRSLTADDSSERTFWTGDGAPKWTDNTIGLSAPPYPSVVRTLGVPAPLSAPTVTIQVAGAGTSQTRAYLWTWVTDKGEESAPSPAKEVAGASDATYRVNFNGEAPASLRGIATRRIYRTTTGTSGSTAFYFVGEVALAATFFDDNNSVTPTQALPSLTWIEPPADLKGLKALWNGVMAAFRGKSIRFCEPYRPFAWPIQYELVVDDTIVALGVWQQNLLVLTTGRPYLITGSDPASMSLQPLDLNQSCVAKRGVVEFGHGVAYPSPDGLTYVGNSGSSVITAGLFMREDWQSMIRPTSLVASEYEGIYIASYDPGTGQAGFMLDPLNPSGVYFLTGGFDAIFRDTITDGLYLLNGTAVKKWDGSPTLRTATFESRTELLSRPVNLGFGRVIADGYPVTLRIVCDAAERFNGTVGSGDLFRLPGGFLADQWRVEIVTGYGVQAVLLSDSARELQRVVG